MCDCDDQCCVNLEQVKLIVWFDCVIRQTAVSSNLLLIALSCGSRLTGDPASGCRQLFFVFKERDR